MTHRVFPRTAQALLTLLFILSLASCAAKNPSADTTDLSSPGSAARGTYAREALDRELGIRPNEDLSQLTPQERTALGARTGLEFDLDTYDTEEVQQYFAFFTHRARGTFTAWLDRSEQYLPFVRETLSSHGLPQDLALLPYSESGYNPKAVSPAGAVGMWQFMRGTAHKYGLTVDWWIDERRDPVLSTHAAARYLADLYGMFGDWYLALAAYNAGEGKISTALEKTNANDFFELCDNNDQLRGKAKLKAETRHYVPKFIAISKIFQNLEMLGFSRVDWTRAPQLADVKLPGGTDLVNLASAAGLKWSEFAALNPAFLRQVSPPGVETTAHLPKDKLEPVTAYLANPKSRPYAGYTVHTVRGSDSLWKIGRRYGVPVAVLKRMNNLASGRLSKGQQLLVPGGGSARDLADDDSGSRGPAKTRRIAQSRSNYVVQRDDTLWNISRKFGISVATLQQANGLNSGSHLDIGQRLYIPDQTGEASRQSKQEAETVQKKLAESKQQESRKSQTAQTRTTSYTVRDGDTLYSIARRFNVSLTDLLRWNSLNNGTTIHAGQEIKVYLR